MAILGMQTSEISKEKKNRWGHFSRRFHGLMMPYTSCCWLVIGIQFELNSYGMECICIHCDWSNDIDFIDRNCFETNQISAPDQIVWPSKSSSKRREIKNIFSTFYYRLPWIFHGITIGAVCVMCAVYEVRSLIMSIMVLS